MPPLGIPERELRALQILNRRDVRYLLIGGYAMRFHGIDRKTEDVDLLVANAESDVPRLYEALVEILGYTPKFTMQDLEQPLKQASFKNAGYEIDILTSVNALDFEAAYSRRERAVVEATPIPVVSRECLIRLKRSAAAKDASRQARELYDVSLLEKLAT